jgi:hypothetical protein
MVIDITHITEPKKTTTTTRVHYVCTLLPVEYMQKRIIAIHILKSIVNIYSIPLLQFTPVHFFILLKNYLK